MSQIKCDEVLINEILIIFSIEKLPLNLECEAQFNRFWCEALI